MWNPLGTLLDNTKVLEVFWWKVLGQLHKFARPQQFANARREQRPMRILDNATIVAIAPDTIKAHPAIHYKSNQRAKTNNLAQPKCSSPLWLDEPMRDPSDDDIDERNG